MNKKKIWISMLSTLLLLAMGTSVAFADVHPSQMGAQGGAGIPEISNQIPPQISAPVSNAPAQDYTDYSGSYLPSANEEFPGMIYPDYSEYGDYNNAPIYDQSYYSEGGAFVPDSYVPDYNNTPSAPTGSSGGAQTLDWYGVGFDLINANKDITIYDVNTGTTWSARYINGKNHADIIPASASDASKIAANGITSNDSKTNYIRRPVLVTIAGTQYAGSMYAVGHGTDQFCDYFNGVMCIHFTGSQTHGSGKVDSDHQNAISEALNYGNGN